MSRTAAQTSTDSKVDLSNAVAASGPTVTNLQREVNSLNAFTGRTAGTAYNATPGFTNNGGFTSSDDLYDRVNELSGREQVTGFTVANNQGSAADVTGMDLSTHEAAVITAQLKRKTDTNEKGAIVMLYVIKRFNSSTYELLQEDKVDTDHGVTFSITSAGQVQYTSDNMAGTNYVGTLTWRKMGFNVPTP